MNSGKKGWREVTQESASTILSDHKPMNRLYAETALSLGLRVFSCADMNLLRIESSTQTEYIQGSAIALNHQSGNRLSKKKQVTNFLLEDMGVIPEWTFMTKKQYEKDGLTRIEGLPFPLIVKPTSELQGNGVIVNLQTSEELEAALEKSFETYSEVIIQEFVGGLKEFRVTVLNGELLGVLERVPAYVTGNGQSTIAELIEVKNIERAAVTDIKLKPIVLDDELHRKLAEQELTIGSIPANGEDVRVKGVCSMSAGGEIFDVTDIIAPENVAIAVEAAQRIQLRIAGIDFICEDISLPLTQQRGGILEVNVDPDIAMHHYPSKGESRDIAGPSLKALFNL